ncbi:MAG TPA: SpoIIE family protein phosphatase [Methyloversatilis sp.]
MTDETIKRVRFRRGTDRRLTATGQDIACRRQSKDRRQHGIGWAALFRGTDEAAVADAVGDCEVLVMPPGALLLNPGEANDNVFLLLSGQLGAFLDNNLTGQPAVSILPGETVGEMSAIDGQPVSAFVLALTEARVLRLPQEVFFQRLSAIPGIARNLLSVLSGRMRRSNEVMLESQRRRMELEYLQQELDIARQLQASMLPLHRPMFPGRTDIEIAALMEPASAVGGDLFDAFFVDDRHLFFCIGDVSGHGIPAALFMARVIGLMRITAMGTREPDRLLQQINDQLCAGNDTNMFVTLLCGCLNMETGNLTYSNGGHCAPVLVRDGQASLLPLPKGALIGVIPGGRYLACEVVLNDGDTLISFTDGVTEAEAANGEEFGPDRLLEIAAMHGTRPLDELIDGIRVRVAEFSDNQPLADDCTLLAVRRPKKQAPTSP